MKTPFFFPVDWLRSARTSFWKDLRTTGASPVNLAVLWSLTLKRCIPDIGVAFINCVLVIFSATLSLAPFSAN